MQAPPDVPMSTLVLTGYDDAMACVGELTRPSIENFANRWGFNFECIREYHDRKHPSFQKVEAILDWLTYYENIIWIDADSIITNHVINPLSFSKPGLNVSTDWGRPQDFYEKDIPFMQHFSMGNFVVTPEFIPSFEWVLKQEQWWFKPQWEQSATQEGVGSGDIPSDLVHIHPRRFLNAVDKSLGEIIDPKTGRPFHHGNPVSEPWSPGDFLCHVTGRTPVERIKQFDIYFRTGAFPHPEEGL